MTLNYQNFTNASGMKKKLFSRTPAVQRKKNYPFLAASNNGNIVANSPTDLHQTPASTKQAERKMKPRQMLKKTIISVPTMMVQDQSVLKSKFHEHKDDFEVWTSTQKSESYATAALRAHRTESYVVRLMQVWVPRKDSNLSCRLCKTMTFRRIRKKIQVNGFFYWDFLPLISRLAFHRSGILTVPRVRTRRCL